MRDHRPLRRHGNPSAEPRVEVALEDLPASLTILTQALAGVVPLESVRSALDDRFVVRVGGFRFRLRPETWMAHMRFLRSRRSLSYLRATTDRAHRLEGGWYELSRRWHAERGGESVSSQRLGAAYRLVDGVIVEIRTRPSNYTMIFGAWAGSPIGFAVICARFWWWLIRGRKLHDS